LPVRAYFAAVFGGFGAAVVVVRGGADVWFGGY